MFVAHYMLCLLDGQTKAAISRLGSNCFDEAELEMTGDTYGEIELSDRIQAPSRRTLSCLSSGSKQVRHLVHNLVDKSRSRRDSGNRRNGFRLTRIKNGGLSN